MLRIQITYGALTAYYGGGGVGGWVGLAGCRVGLVSFP